LTKKIGIMVGRENTFPNAFIEEVNRRKAGVEAEFVKLDGTGMAEECPYDVIVDRISHEVPYYRTFLRTAMVSGTVIVNNPFWWSASDDKLFGATLCARLGIAHPHTIALPTHAYIEGIDLQESLRNLRERIPWEQHVAHVGGFPVILKPNAGGGFKKVFKLHTLDQLWEAYNQTGTDVMILQEFIEWEQYVRCLVIGQEQVLVMKFDINAPYPHRYFDEPDYLTKAEHDRVVDSALKIVRAFGYDMNTCEFALKGGVPYAIDFTNPAPDMDYWSLKEKFFTWVVTAMADMCIAKALAGRYQFPELNPRALAGPSVSAGTAQARG
jgi:RimK-like ATP-grasp domain